MLQIPGAVGRLSGAAGRRGNGPARVGWRASRCAFATRHARAARQRTGLVGNGGNVARGECQSMFSADARTSDSGCAQVGLCPLTSLEPSAAIRTRTGR